MFDDVIIKILNKYDNCYVNSCNEQQFERIQKKLKCNLIIKPTVIIDGGYIIERLKNEH